MPVKDLVLLIVKEIVDYPDEVEVSEVSTTRTIVIEVKVSKDDAGKVIGKNGRIAEAIRTITKSAAGKQNKNTSVEIITH